MAFPECILRHLVESCPVIWKFLDMKAPHVRINFLSRGFNVSLKRMFVYYYYYYCFELFDNIVREVLLGLLFLTAKIQVLPESRLCNLVHNYLQFHTRIQVYD